MRCPRHIILLGRHRRLLVGLLMLLAMAAALPFTPLYAAPVAAGEPDASPATRLDVDQYDLPIHDYELANGLRVLLVDDPSAPVVAVNVTYLVGSANDPPGRSGFAHLFEHLMFFGSENVARGEFDDYLTRIGAVANGTTYRDVTVYDVTVPSHYLPLVLWLESDRMDALVVDQEALRTERQVVIEELNEALDTVYGPAFLREEVLSYQGYAPYEDPGIGSAADLNQATLAEIQAFHAQYYLPNNAILAIVGDIDIAQTKALVDAYFGDIPAGEPVIGPLQIYPLPEQFPVVRVDEESGCQVGYEEVIVDPRADLPAALAGVVGPGPGHPDYYALDVLAEILSAGSGSRLHQNIVAPGLAVEAWVEYYTDMLQSSDWTAGIFANPDEDVAEAAQLLRAEFANVWEEGVSETELARAKNRIELDMITDFRDSALATTGWLQWFTRVYDDPDRLEQEVAHYLAVTAEDVERVAQTYLCDRPLNWITVLQEGEPVTSAYPGQLVEPVEVMADPLHGLPAGVVSRQEPPATLPEVDLSLAPYVAFELDNGLQVIVVEEHKTPELTAMLYVGSGDVVLPAAEQGVAQLLAEMLVEGTLSRPAHEIASAIEDLGGGIFATADLETIVVTAYGPSTQSDVLFDILADVSRNPAFPEAAFAVVQEQSIIEMESYESDPDRQAWRQYQRIVFPGHPYGFYATPETMARLTREDLAAFHENHFTPGNAVLVIAGDLTVAEARIAAEQAFGDWTGELPTPFPYPAVEMGDTSVIYVVDLPDAEQATIVAGNRAIAFTHPSRYALYVANHMLGGTVNSRLYRNLRDRLGYTYGVYSQVQPLQDPGYFYVYGSVGQDVAGESVREILSELARLHTDPLPAEEVAHAKSYLISAYLMDMADRDNYANLLGSIAIDGFPLELVNEVVDNYAAVSARAAQRAARRYIDAEQPVIVVAGDAEVVGPQLAELGEVVVVDTDGNRVE